MRTTLTLDEDVAARLRREMRRSGQSFKETVNTLLRHALAAKRTPRPASSFRVRARPLGLRPGLDYDNVGDLIEQLEGPQAR